MNDNISISSYREYDEGVRGVVYEDERLRIMCNEGVLRSMYDHSIKGLPEEEDGTADGRAVEVKGYLLGSVTIEDDVHVVEIKKTVPLPIGNFDHGEGAYFDASDEARLSHYLKRNPELQMVGNFHSHPNHPIMLSDADVKYLSGVLSEPFHVAIVVAPREKALGFFVKNAEGAYAIEQEHDVRVSFDATGKPRVRWLAVDKEHVEKVSEFPLKKVAIIAAAAVAVIVLAILIIGGGEGAPPKLIVSSGQISLDAGSQSAEVAVSLDQEGEYTIQLTPKDDYSWLTIENSQRNVVYPEISYHTITADLMALASNDSVTAIIGISAVKRAEDPPDIAEKTISVDAKRSVAMFVDEREWNLSPLRVRGRELVLDMGDIPTASPAKVVISARTVGRGVQPHRVYSETLLDPVTIRIPATNLGNPLEWVQVVLDARTEETYERENAFRTFKFVGTQRLGKRNRTWDMTCEQVGRGLVFTADALNHPAYWRLRSREDGKWQDLRESLSDAGKPFHERVEMPDGVEAYRFEAAYVGSTEIVHLTFNYTITEDDMSVVLYDETQGRAGREFRTEYPETFEAAGLIRLGEYGGPPHIDDLTNTERGARVRILSNNQVNEWLFLVNIDERASAGGHGRIAWNYSHEENKIAVFIVVSEDDLNVHLGGRSWFLDQIEISQLLKDSGRLALKFFDGESAGVFKR